MVRALLALLCLALTSFSWGAAGDASATLPGQLNVIEAENLQQPYIIVATNGVDGPSCGQSVSSPCGTVQQAENLASPGTTIYVRGGTYNENVVWNNSGTAGNYITLRSYPGEIAVISGSHQVDNPNGGEFDPGRRLLSLTADYVRIKNMEFADSAGQSINLGQGADNNIIEYNRIHDWYGTGIQMYETNNNTVRGNIVHDMFDYGVGYDPATCGSTSCGGDSDCIGASGRTISNSWGNHLIEDNVVYNCSDDGIDIWVTRDNTIRNNTVFHVGFQGSGTGLAGDGNAFKVGSAETSGTSGFSTLYNNIAFDTRRRGFDTNGGSDNVYWNNTAWDIGSTSFQCGTNDTFINNLEYQSASRSTSCSGTTNTTNSWNLGITDPGFLSTTYGDADFLVPSDPDAINSGTDVGLPFNGSAPDIGAIETIEE